MKKGIILNQENLHTVCNHLGNYLSKRKLKSFASLYTSESGSLKTLRNSIRQKSIDHNSFNFSEGVYGLTYIKNYTEDKYFKSFISLKDDIKTIFFKIEVGDKILLVSDGIYVLKNIESGNKIIQGVIFS